jgi:hypothetical protein
MIDKFVNGIHRFNLTVTSFKLRVASERGNPAPSLFISLPQRGETERRTQ